MTAENLPPDKSKAIWEVFGRALGADPRKSLVISGASGLEHVVEGISVDDKNRRVIVFSAESNPRIAALMQVDIQATIPGSRVLVARPIAFDLAAMARHFVGQLGSSELNLKELGERIETLKQGREENDPELLNEAVGGIITPIVTTFRHAELPPLNQIVAAVQQVALLDWPAIGEQLQLDPSGLIIPLTNLITRDSMAIDRQYGVCPIPLYEFSELDWQLLLSGRSVDELRERLRAMGILQYFFPPPDHVALGLADRQRTTPTSIEAALNVGPSIGHPLGETELLSRSTSVAETVESLIGLGLLVEGEMGLEVTEAGTSVRASVKFRPRESFLSKLIQRFNANVNVSVSPKDFLPPQ